MEIHAELAELDASENRSQISLVQSNYIKSFAPICFQIEYFPLDHRALPLSFGLKIGISLKKKRSTAAL